MWPTNMQHKGGVQHSTALMSPGSTNSIEVNGCNASQDNDQRGDMLCPYKRNASLKTLPQHLQESNRLSACTAAYWLMCCRRHATAQQANWQQQPMTKGDNTPCKLICQASGSAGHALPEPV